jgi:long-chain acyl-CoA synthetase
MSNNKLLFDFQSAFQNAKANPYCLFGKHNGNWLAHTIGDLIEKSENMSKHLENLGLKKGECVAVIANNCPEWIFTDMAIMRAGGITVPIYVNESQDHYNYILNDADIKICFVENKVAFDKVKDIHKINVFSFERIAECSHYETLFEKLFIEYEGVHPPSISSEDIATIIYTSGTTGKPKGVMLSHQNLLSNIEACSSRLPVATGDRALSFLPIAHVFERMLVYLYLHNGLTVYFEASLDHIPSALHHVKPHIFTAVPRVVEKFMEAIIRESQHSYFKRKLVEKVLSSASKFPDTDWHFFLLDKFVFKKIKHNLGGHLKAIICGSAQLNPELNKTFWGIGIPIYEGYGMTETSPVVSVNYPDNTKIGSVGKPIENVQIKLSDEQEILVKGPNVMIGYYKLPELTKEVIDADGFIHTGDLGAIDSDGYLTITGRKKELFKTSGGKYINPVVAESEFQSSSYIENIIVIGENRKFPSALIVPNIEAISEALDLKINEDKDEFLRQEKVKDLMDKEVARLNQKLGHWELIKEYRLLPTTWSVETGELTPKLSLKRNAISKKYESIIETIYNN